MKKPIAIFLMSLFTLGMIVIPLVHDLSKSSLCGHGDLCCNSHSESHKTDSASRESSAGLHHEIDIHDSLICVICQLANLSLSAPSVSAMAPDLDRVIDEDSVLFSQPDYASPRLQPFSCGPPV